MFVNSRSSTEQTNYSSDLVLFLVERYRGSDLWSAFGEYDDLTNLNNFPYVTDKSDENCGS